MSHAQEGNRQQAKARTTEANSSKEKGKEKQLEVMDTMFVGWVPGSQNEPRKTAPRLHHKKSRTGCQQCRARRVKCNEVHPVCGSCARHQTTCIWGRPGQSPRSNSPNSTTGTKPKPYTIRPKLSPHLTSTPSDWDEPPESRFRRLTELHLMHHYMAITAITMGIPGDRNSAEWSISVPKLALKHNSLLYAIYTFTAMHIAKLDPGNLENIAAYQRYLGLTLREHRDEVGVLSRANADAALMTSSFLRVINFSLLQDRILEPYTPPTEWLQMSSSTGRGLNVEAWKFIADDSNSIMRNMIANAPGLRPGPLGWLRDDSVVFRESNRQDLLHLLRRTSSDLVEEPWNADIQHAYETTTSYIGSIQLSIAAKDHAGNIFRSLILFPTMVDKQFIDLVKEQRPRALVILAHFFAFLWDFRDFWWIGDCGKREVRAIEVALNEEWRELMVWPLQAVEDIYCSS